MVNFVKFKSCQHLLNVSIQASIECGDVVTAFKLFMI